MLTVEGYEGDFETYTRLYREGRVPWGDYWYHLAVSKTASNYHRPTIT
jgi:hypothetical protein